MISLYKQVGKTILVFSLFCLIFTGAAAYASETFTVSNVIVDVTAEDAVTARAQAFNRAQRDAFQKLAQRLLSENEFSELDFELIDIEIISSLVNDFEITKEQISDVRYIGTYIFRFKNEAVRNHLSGYGISYTDVSSKAVLILPFYQWGTRTILWEDENLWYQAWGRRRNRQGLVPTVIPVGGLEDISVISGTQMLTYDASELQDMAIRYGAGTALIVLAAPVYQESAPEVTPVLQSLKLTLYSTGAARPTYLKSFDVLAHQGEALDALFERSAQKVSDELQSNWKSQTMVSAGQSNSLKVRVVFSSMREWIDTQKVLRRVQGVNEVKLLSLKPGAANVELSFQGTESRLRLALAQADMTLSTPQLNFSSAYGGRYNSPLVYELYLNKYR